tara:strand:- start:659 stop:814 length:156 start_codon:yes stop_codon:yes gene_type:complete
MIPLLVRVRDRVRVRARLRSVAGGGGGSRLVGGDGAGMLAVLAWWFSLTFS